MPKKRTLFKNQQVGSIVETHNSVTKNLSPSYIGRSPRFPPVGWGALDGGEAGQSPAMSHGMARIRLGRLERVFGALTSIQKTESVKGWKGQMKKRVEIPKGNLGPML